MFSGVFSTFSSDALISIANNSIPIPTAVMASGKSNVPEEHHSQWLTK